MNFLELAPGYILKAQQNDSLIPDFQEVFGFDIDKTILDFALLSNDIEKVLDKDTLCDIYLRGTIVFSAFGSD